MSAYVPKQGERFQGGSRPATPPVTPARNKRRLDRSDSPASSIHPAETTSPAKKVVKRSSRDNIRVEELTEGDLGYATDIDVIYPEELEEYDSESSSSEYDGPDTPNAMARRLSRLTCNDDEGTAQRRQRHLRRRAGSRLFKRTHSQSVESDGEELEPEQLDAHDVGSSARRLRRRVRGPGQRSSLVFEDIPRSEPDAGAVDTGSSPEQTREREVFGGLLMGEDSMEVDVITPAPEPPAG